MLCAIARASNACSPEVISYPFSSTTIYIAPSYIGPSAGRLPPQVAHVAYMVRNALGRSWLCDTRAMPKRPSPSKPEPSQPTTWSIYKFAARLQWVGVAEATDEADAIEKAAAEFKIAGGRLIAERRR